MPGTTARIPLDPSKWETPKSRFIGIIEVCEYSDTDQSKTKDGQTFTEFYQWPRAGQTWRTVVRRLDAVYKNKETGELIPEVKRYQDIALERYDAERKTWRSSVQGDNKAQYTIEKWMGAKVMLADPELNVGLVAEFEVEASHRFGRGGNPARNLLYPIKVLARPGSDYEFRGDVEEIEFDPSRDEGDLDETAKEVEASQPASKRNGSTNGSKPANTLSDAALLALFVGLPAEDNDDAVMEIVAEHKADIAPPVRATIINGTFLSEAMESGKLVVNDGYLAEA